MDMTLNFDFSNLDKKEKAVDPEVVETTPFDHFDITKAKNDQFFLTIMAKMKEMRQKATDLKIIDVDTNNTAMEMLVQIKALINGADDVKKKLPQYAKAAIFKNGMDEFVQEQIKKPFENLNKIISPKISFFQKTQAELERKKAAKKAADDAEAAKKEADRLAKEQRDKEESDRQAAIDLQAKLNLEADEAGVERVSVPIPEISNEPIVPIVPEIPVTQKSEKVVTDYGTGKIESVWIVKIINPEMVGRNYCSPDQKKLAAAVETGIREIAGCVIEESFDPKIRLSRKKKEPEFTF